jgi:hypothetical protein
MDSILPIEHVFGRSSSEVELRSFVARFHLKALKGSVPSRQYIADWTGAVEGKAVFSRHRQLAATAPSGSPRMNALSLSISAPDRTHLCRADVRFD